MDNWDPDNPTPEEMALEASKQVDNKVLNQVYLLCNTALYRELRGFLGTYLMHHDYTLVNKSDVQGIRYSGDDFEFRYLKPELIFEHLELTTHIPFPVPVECGRIYICIGSDLYFSARVAQ